MRTNSGRDGAEQAPRSDGKTASIAQEIYLSVRGQISSQELAGGTRVTEQALAEEFGTSRTPAREAMRMLVAEGFLVFKPNSGSFVRTWDKAQISEIFNLRLVLECEIAALAALRITDDEVERLRQLVTEQETAAAAQRRDMFDVLTSLNREFHRIIASASRNERLTRMLGSAIEVPIVQSTYRRYDRAQLQRSQHHHRELCDALQAHDGEWARAVMHCHIRSAHNVMLANHHAS